MDIKNDRTNAANEWFRQLISLSLMTLRVFQTCIVNLSQLHTVPRTKGYRVHQLNTPTPPILPESTVIGFLFSSGPPPVTCWFQILWSSFLIGVHSRPFSDNDAECSSLLPMNNAGFWIWILMKEIIDAYHDGKRNSLFANDILALTKNEMGIKIDRI